MPENWRNTAISMVDFAFQPPVVERVEALLKLNYKINYSTWPFSSAISNIFPLPSTQVWENDFGGKRLEAEYGLDATLKLLDEALTWLQANTNINTDTHKVCNCSTVDLFRRGCKC